MSTPAKPGFGRKILKVAGIICGCLVGLLVIATILLFTLLEPYAERYLKRQVVEKSDGLYQLDFDAIDINLLSTTLRLRQLHLYPDTSVHQQQLEAGEASSLLIEIKSPEFEVGQLNLLDLLFRNRLNIRHVLLDSADITLLADARAAQDTASEQDGGNPLPSFLESVRIGDLHMPDATLRYLAREDRLVPEHILPQLSFRLLDMELRELDQSDHTRMFRADDLQLSFRDYAYQTRDSVYSGHVGSFSYSSKQGELLVEDFLLKGDEEANVARGPAEASPLLLALSSSRLQITGMDVEEAFRSKQLLIADIALDNAKLEVLENPDIPATTGKVPDLAEFYENLMEYLQVIGIEDFRLGDARFLYHSRQQGEITTIHELQHLDVALQTIRLDSSTLFHPKDTFPVNNIDLTARGYAYQHPLSPYSVDIARLGYSTSEAYLQLDSLHVRGDWDKNDRLKQLNEEAHFVVYNLKTPRIRIRDMDLIRAYQASALDVGKLEVVQPDFDIMYDKTVDPPDVDSLYINTYYALSDIIKELKLGEIRLQDAAFTQHIKEKQVTQLQKLEQATLVLRGIAIDSGVIFRGEPTLPLQDVVLTARNYTLRTPDSTQTLSLDRLRYTSLDQELSALSIDVESNPRANDRQKKTGEASPGLFDLSATKFRVTGLDLITSLNSGRLDIDQIILSEPELSLLKDRDDAASTPDQSPDEALEDLFDLVNPITVNAIRLEEGTFTYHEKREDIVRTQVLEQLSATITGLQLSPAVLSSLEDEMPMEEIRFTARDYTYRSPDSLYTISLNSLQYSSLQQQLTARVFKVEYDRETHEQRKEENIEEASRNLFDIDARKFTISGFDVVHAYNTGRYNMKEMLLSEPQVNILQDKNVALQQDEAEQEESSDQEQQEGDSEEEEEAGTAEETMEQLAEFVETFRVERLRIEEGTFELNILEDTIQKSQTLEHVSLVLDQLRLISLEAADPLEMFAVDDLGLRIRDYTLLTEDSLYEFRIGEIRSSLGSQSLFIDSINLEPLFKIDEYAETLEYAEDRAELKIGSLALSGFDMSTFLNEQEIRARRLLINQPELNLYRDRRVAEDPNRYPPTLQKMLRDVPYTVVLDTILVQDGEIIYSEVAANGVEPGVLTLAELSLEITNVTNDPEQIRKNDLAAVKGSSLLMDESKLEASFDFHLNHPTDLFTIEGSLEPMDFEAFNPLFEKLMFVRMESGHINKAVFTVKADKDVAEGDMRFLYNKLELQLVDKEEPENPGVLLNAGSWLINNLVIKSNNPSRLGNLRKGDIEVGRDYQKSVFNHMGNAMMNGMSSSLMPSLVEKIVRSFADLP